MLANYTSEMQTRTGALMIYLLDQRCHVEAGQRRLFGRFEDNSVPTGERWTQLPRCHHQREVPLMAHTHTPEKDIMHLPDTLGGHKSGSITRRSQLTYSHFHSKHITVRKSSGYWRHLFSPTVFRESWEIAAHVQ